MFRYHPSKLPRNLLITAAIVAILAMSVSAVAAQSEFISKRSPHDFATTVANVKKQIAANKLVLLKEYNVQMMLKMVGVTSGRSVTMATFHPRYGKVIYENDMSAAAAAPLRIVVQERDDGVIVGYVPASVVFASFDVPSSLTGELDTLLASILEGATK